MAHISVVWNCKHILAVVAFEDHHDERENQLLLLLLLLGSGVCSTTLSLAVTTGLHKPRRAHMLKVFALRMVVTPIATKIDFPPFHLHPTDQHKYTHTYIGSGFFGVSILAKRRNSRISRLCSRPSSTQSCRA